MTVKTGKMKVLLGLALSVGALGLTAGTAKADPDCLPELKPADYDCQKNYGNARAYYCEKVGGQPLPTLIQLDLNGDCHKDVEYSQVE